MNNIPKQITVQLSDQDRLVCSGCGNDTFEQQFFVHKLPMMLVGSQPQVAPVPIFACVACGALLDVSVTKTKREIDKN